MWCSRSFTPPVAASMVTRDVILSTLPLSRERSEESGAEGRDNGPRTILICILLKDRLLQNIVVRGPYFFEGTANKPNLYLIKRQSITKYRCSRSVERLCARSISPFETAKLKTHTFPGDPDTGCPATNQGVDEKRDAAVCGISFSIS